MSAGSEVTRQLKDIVADSREQRMAGTCGFGSEAPFFLPLKGQRSPPVYKLRYLLKKNSGLEEIHKTEHLPDMPKFLEKEYTRK